jgi:hypothetical protein
MRFIILVKASAESEAGQRPSEEMLEAMGRYSEEMRRAGVLIDAAGLKPSSKGARVRYSGSRTQVVDGPFTESKELVGGYSIIEAKSLDEAVAWAMKMPNPGGADGEVEIRPLHNLDDFGPSPAVDKYFRGKGYSAES